MGARDRRGRLRNRLTPLVVGLFLVAVVATPALAAELSVEPSPVSAGQWVEVEGEGFGWLLVSLSFDGVFQTTVSADLDGEFETQLQIPADAAPGPHTITAASLFTSASATVVVKGADTTTTTSTTTTTTTTTTPSTTTTTTTPSTTTTAPSTTTTTTAPSTTTSTAPLSTTSTLAPSTTGPTTTTTDPFQEEPGESTTTTRPQSTSTTAVDDQTTTSTTLPSVTTAITLPFTDDGWEFGAGAEAAPGEPAPEVAETRVTIGQFSVDPGSGPPGAVIKFAFSLDRVIPGLDTIELAIGGTQIGDAVTVTPGGAAIDGTVPSLPPGTYEVTASHDGVTLASAPFEVTELQVAGGTRTPPQIWLAIPLVLVILALAWRTMREVRDSLPPGQRLGPVSAWRVRRGRPPIG